jgi:predicted metal-dependent peptidase
MSNNAADKITRAKARLVANQPFFAHILLSVPVEEARWQPTMCTDMIRIWYNPDFVDKMSVEETMGVLCHEVLHIAYRHGLRKKHRNHKGWNIACDFAINPIVLDSRLKLPAGGLFDPKYKDMSAEEIYELLKEQFSKMKQKFPGQPGQDGEGQGDGDGDGDGEPMWGGVMEPTDKDGKPLSEAERTTLEHDIKTRVASAAEMAKSIGKLPGGVEGLIEAVGRPTIDWHSYIQQWVKGTNPDDATWAKPNRRMLANHRVYMPQIKTNGAGIGVLNIDTSGSVSDDELRWYVREIVGVIEMCKPDKLFIIQHEAIVQKVEEWEGGDDFKSLKVKGRGGTCIQPSFDYIAKNIDDEINWMINFTDCGISDYPKVAPDFPVLWAATGPDNTPFGTYIRVKND